MTTYLTIAQVEAAEHFVREQTLLRRHPHAYAKFLITRLEEFEPIVQPEIQVEIRLIGEAIRSDFYNSEVDDGYCLTRLVDSGIEKLYKQRGQRTRFAMAAASLTSVIDRMQEIIDGILHMPHECLTSPLSQLRQEGKIPEGWEFAEEQQTEQNSEDQI